MVYGCGHGNRHNKSSTCGIADEALTHAAHLVALAEPFATVEFKDVLNAVEHTLEKGLNMQTLKVHPNWSHTGIRGDQIAAFLDPTRKFEFAGSGFYLTDTDTLLIIPQIKAETHSWWRAKQLPI